MKFKLNQTVVHSSHGVGKIVGIETREFTPGNSTEFYIVQIQDFGVPKKAFVPTKSAEACLTGLVENE